MVRHWKKLAPEEFYGKTVFASLSQGCFMRFPQNDTNKVITEILHELTTDREEANIILLFHTKHASTAFLFIIIKTPYTGVFLSLGQQHELSTDLYVV